MATKPTALTIADLRGGRNGADPPLALPANQCVEALNVDFYQSTLGRKRPGSAALSLTSAPFTGIVSSLIRHVPGADETAAELWGVDAATPPNIGRRAAAGWSTISPADAIASKPAEVHGVSHNGKLYLAFDSAVDRLHVWDGTSLRRVGLATPTAPTVANTGSGTYAAIARYYKVAWTTQASGVTVRRSELSPASTVFTPSGSGAAARVTRPTAASESETHWELYASADNLTYYCIATVALATTTYDDSTLPSAYTGAQPDEVGANIPPPSVKYLLSDGNRLLMGGSRESGGRQSRVWFTPVLNASGVGNDERIPDTTDLHYYVDVDEYDGGYLTGFGGPMMGSPFVFKYREVWKFVPTGLSASPYRPLCESKVIGAINQASIVLAEDESGHPALYFLSHRGPYRLGSTGLEYAGHDVEDIWATVNLDASNVVAHGVYHSALHQIWWWIATGSSNDPDTRIVFDTKLGRSTVEGVRGGWTKHTGSAAGARCSALGGVTIGVSQTRALAPYFGRSTGTAIWKGDTGTDDAGTTYQGLITMKPYLLAGLGKNVSVDEPYLMAEASAGAVVQVTVEKDFGVETQQGTAVLTAQGSETRVQRKIEGVGAGQAGAVRLTIGDAAASSATWSLDAVSIPYKGQEDR